MLSMTTIEKPTVPTPVKMLEVSPALNKGNLLSEPEEVDTFDAPVLGAVATREEYRQEQTEMNDQVVDPAQLDRDAEAAKVTLSRDAEDDKVRDELFSGFHINDATQPEVTIDEDHDELPEDLKDDLGEPDNDEVVASNDEVIESDDEAREQ